MSLHPSAPQVGGTLTGAITAIFSERVVGWLGIALASPYVKVVLTAAIGATVGFFVTAFWRFLFDKLKGK